ncbi:MAG: CarD family transcriptional regulator [Myxococcota bacterium]
MDFKTGERAVYPGCGVGIIDDIEDVDLGAGSTSMYVLQFPDDKTRIWVPAANAASLGLRRVMSPRKAQKTLEVITAQEAPPKRQTWNRRFRRYSEKIQTNEPTALGEVLGELAAIKNQKALSFGERKIYRQVHDLLVAELAIAGDKSPDVMLRELDALLDKN